MKKYYDMPNSKMVAMLDWKDGYGTLEQAREYLSDKDTREISKKEIANQDSTIRSKYYCGNWEYLC